MAKYGRYGPEGADRTYTIEFPKPAPSASQRRRFSKSNRGGIRQLCTRHAPEQKAPATNPRRWRAPALSGPRPWGCAGQLYDAKVRTNIASWFCGQGCHKGHDFAEW